MKVTADNGNEFGCAIYNASIVSTPESGDSFASAKLCREIVLRRQVRYTEHEQAGTGAVGGISE